MNRPFNVNLPHTWVFKCTSTIHQVGLKETPLHSRHARYHPRPGRERYFKDKGGWRSCLNNHDKTWIICHYKTRYGTSFCSLNKSPMHCPPSLYRQYVRQAWNYKTYYNMKLNRTLFGRYTKLYKQLSRFTHDTSTAVLINWGVVWDRF